SIPSKHCVMNDLKFACRQLLKNPGFTAVAVLTLALGIGANTAMFSVLNVLLLRALPYPNSERLVRVFRTSPQSQTWPHSVANFFDQPVNELDGARKIVDRNLANFGLV